MFQLRQTSDFFLLGEHMSILGVAIPNAALKALIATVCVAFIACQTTKQKNKAPSGDNSQKPNTGIVDGNGAEIRTRATFELPNKADIDAFLKRLEPVEQV